MDTEIGNLSLSAGDLLSDEEDFETEDLLANSASLEESDHMSSKTPNSDSNFGDSECGEPMRAQHLVIDFTLDKNIDNDDSQQKVCDFWEYINSRPDIQHLMVLPDPIMSETGALVDQAVHQEEEVAADKLETAVSTLELCDEYGATSRAFDIKMCMKCSENNMDYFEDQDRKYHHVMNYTFCDCAGVCKCSKKPPKDPTKPREASQSVVDMCSQLEDWDQKHPKPMDPPGPLFQHLPILQRRLEPPI